MCGVRPVKALLLLIARAATGLRSGNRAAGRLVCILSVAAAAAAAVAASAWRCSCNFAQEGAEHSQLQYAMPRPKLTGLRCSEEQCIHTKHTLDAAVEYFHPGVSVTCPKPLLRHLLIRTHQCPDPVIPYVAFIHAHQRPDPIHPPTPGVWAHQVFLVDVRASKRDIRNAVSRMYDIQTKKINTLIR